MPAGKKVDAVIVGAGPAGSTAAFVLARAGLSVVLLDAASFPREKLCGGLLSARAGKIYGRVFDGSWDSVIEYTACGAGFYDKYHLIQSVTHPAPLSFTSRTSFDAHLVELACSKGALLLEQSAAATVDADASTVRCTDGREIRADFILGCDGARSRIARAVAPGLTDKRKMAAGLEVHLPKDCLAREVTQPEIYFGLVDWGYAWLFPKRDCVTAGLAGFAPRNRNLPEVFRNFLVEVCAGRPPKLTWKGHPIPFGNYRRRPGRGNILLAGDAAGLVEPITGEGIAFAMLSGEYAAKAVLEAALRSDPTSALSVYERGYRQMTRLFRQAVLMRYLIFPRRMQPLFLRVLARNPRVAEKYLDLLADEIGYGDYTRFLMSRLLNRGLRGIGLRRG